LGRVWDKRDKNMAKYLKTNILNQPYPLFLEFSKSFPAIVGISAFVPLFLFTFKPFDLNDITGREFFLAGFGVLIFVILLFNTFVLTKIAPKLFDEENWTVGKEIIWLLWNVFFCVSGAALYEFTQPECPFTFYQLIVSYSQGFLISIIPVAVITLFSYTGLLKAKLKQAAYLNKRIDNSREDMYDEVITLFSENRREHMRLSTKNLLFIQSSDNYSTIVYKGNGDDQRTLLRSSLKKLQEQLHHSFIIRCHRSFIINLLKVKSVKGNARGYKLILEGWSDPLPVSRELGKQVLQTLKKL
jgi:hypothetical protein